MADRYWVGGTESWNGTAGTKWAATSGAAGGASVPTTADDVFFDGNSTGVVTIATGNTGAKSITCTGFTGTLTGTAAITVAGSITLVAGMTYTHTGTVSITATATLVTAGKAFSGLTVNGAGITVTLGDALDLGPRTLTVTQGTFTTSASNYNVTATTLSSSNSNTRTISLNGSTLSLTASSGSCLNFASSTNLTFNAGTSQINVTSSGAFSGGGQTFYNVSFTNAFPSQLITRRVTGTNTFNNVTLTASDNGVSELSFAANQTINGTLNCAGASESQRGFLSSTVVGTARTLTVATLSAANCDFRDVTVAGAASPATPTNAGDCGGNTNITFPGAKTVYWNLSGTRSWGSIGWATTANGTPAAANFPLPQDTATFTDSGDAGNIDFDNNTFNVGTIDASARTSAVTLDFEGYVNVYGNFTLGTGVTITNSDPVTFINRSLRTITSAGVSLTFPIVIQSLSTVELGDALTTSNSISVPRGTFDAKTYNLTCLSFNSIEPDTRAVNMGSGTWTLSGTGNIWVLQSDGGLTFDKQTANILLSNTSTTSRTFYGGVQTYNKLTIGGAAGTSTLTISNANTFGELASIKTVAHTISLDANQTVTTWSISGSSGNIVTLQSSVASTTRTLTKEGGGFLTGIDYLSVRSIEASPVSDTWYIGANSTINTTAPNLGYGFFTTQRASNAVIVLESTTSASWTVPTDWNNASNVIHLFGGGGGSAGGRASGSNRAGGGGGGGGGYTGLSNQTLTIGASITYQAGSAGGAGAAGANGTAGGTTLWDGGASTAGGGGGGQATTTSSTGGTAGSGSTYNGGVGGQGAVGTAASTGYGGGGGAGAGGPNGIGGTGGNGFGSSTAASIAGGGGGGNGGGTNGGNASAATGGTGGNNSDGAGGATTNSTSGAVGGGGSGSVANLSTGSTGIEVYGIGGGSGGGGEDDTNRTNTGGRYGGGGGGGGVSTGGITRAGSSGAQGVIIITYVPVVVATSTGNFFMLFN